MDNLLTAVIAFLILALVAGGLGFGGIAGESTQIAKILFFVFLVLLLFTVIARFSGGLGL